MGSGISKDMPFFNFGGGSKRDAAKVKAAKEAADEKAAKEAKVQAENFAALAHLMTEEGRSAAEAASLKTVADSNSNYTETRDKWSKVAPGSWSSTEFPPSAVDEPAFGGGDTVDHALTLAEKYKLREPILTMRGGLAAEFYKLQCIICLVVGDSRTAKEDSGLLPPGHKSWAEWIIAAPLDPKQLAYFIKHGLETPTPKPGHEHCKLVMDGIVALQESTAIKNLNTLVSQLAKGVYADIQEEVGGGTKKKKKKSVVVKELNKKPTQALGFESFPDKGRDAYVKLREKDSGAIPVLVQAASTLVQSAGVLFQKVAADVGVLDPASGTRRWMNGGHPKGNEGTIPMADWSPEMHREIKGAVEKLKAGDFNHDKTDDSKDQEYQRNQRKSELLEKRPDLALIMGKLDDPGSEINPVEYLIVLGINRFKTFHAKGLQVALAAGGEKDSYAAGPLKTDSRVDAKCGVGGDYYSDGGEGGFRVQLYEDDCVDYNTFEPTCKRVLDMLRGSVKCQSHAMMKQGYVEAIEIFGDPAVVKDRRDKVQHDLLMVFQVEGFYCELQFHFEDIIAVKSLMHAIFEIQRLSTKTAEGSVLATGLQTVLDFPLNFAPEESTAKDVKLTIHV